MKIPVCLALLVSFAASACYTYRPPTSALEVADTPPENATRVGGPLPFWNDAGPCHSPPPSVVTMAERWGGDVVVPHIVAQGGSGQTRFFCGADAYSIR
jgi:hypothetical protein